MNEAQVLAKLHDIQLPKPIGWWPTAWGWYVLIVFGFLTIAVFVYGVIRLRIRGRAQREALRLLETYYQHYQQERNAQLASRNLSQLLRRVALAYFPREQVAGLQGEAWINFLTQHAKEVDFAAIHSCLLELPYESTRTNNQCEQAVTLFFKYTKMWIKQRGT